MVPDCRAYSIRPYPDGRLFSSEWVGAYCIRPPQRPRQGNERGFFVVSLGDLLGTIRALWCPIVGRIQYAPTLTVEKTGSFFEPVHFPRYPDGQKKGDLYVFRVTLTGIFFEPK